MKATTGMALMFTNVTFVDGTAVVVRPIGGAMVEASLGGQKFAYQAL